MTSKMIENHYHTAPSRHNRMVCCRCNACRWRPHSPCLLRAAADATCRDSRASVRSRRDIVQRASLPAVPISFVHQLLLQLRLHPFLLHLLHPILMLLLLLLLLLLMLVLPSPLLSAALPQPPLRRLRQMLHVAGRPTHAVISKQSVGVRLLELGLMRLVSLEMSWR